MKKKEKETKRGKSSKNPPLEDAIDIKLAVLKLLDSTCTSNEVFASEVNFRSNQSRADMIICSEDRLCSIEVKSPRDDFRRLALQQHWYLKYFRECYIAVEEADVRQAIEATDGRFGLIVVSDGIARITRVAKSSKSLGKDFSMDWLSAKELKTLAAEKGRTAKSRSELLKIVSRKYNRDSLSKAATLSILRKAAEKFRMYRLEKGQALTLDDVATLSTPSRVS